LNTPKLFGGAAAVLLGAVVIMALVLGIQQGFWALLGVGIALYCFIKILNGYERRDIEQRKRNHRRRS
jgi:hypothetical protein